AGDLVNPALLAAVPPDFKSRPTAALVENWPGEIVSNAVRPLAEIGLSGPIDCHARLETNTDGDTELRATIVLRDGRIDPVLDAPRTTRLSKVWPGGLSLENCEAVVLIDPESISLRSFEGHRHDGMLEAKGSFDLQTEDLDAEAMFRNFDIEPYIVELFDPEVRPTAETLWEEWKPRGEFNADLAWASTDGTERTRITLEPELVTINAGGRTQTLRRQAGDLHLDNDLLAVRGLEILCEDPGPGTINVAGTVQLGNPATTDATTEQLELILEDMRFQSPIVDEAFRLAAGNELGKAWRERRPHGQFHGESTLHTDGSNNRISFELIPSSFSMLTIPNDDASRGGGELAPGGRITYHDNTLAIGPMTARSPEGTLVDLDLKAEHLDTSPRIHADWHVQAEKSAAPETGFMPPPLSRLLGADGIQTGKMDARGSVTIEFLERGEAPHEFASTAEMTFEEGRINLGGVSVSGISGDTDIDLLVEQDVVTRLQSTSTVPQALVENRLLTDLVLETTLAEPSGDEMAIDITLTEGTIYEGPLRGNFRFEPETGRYRVETSMDDVALAGLARGETDEPGEDLPGRVLASMAMEGVTGSDASRVGRGELLIRDAAIAGSGGSMAILHLGQLLPPVSRGLDQAEVEFLIDGNEAILSRILLDSPTLQLVGEGRLRISDFSLAARLLPKGQLGAVSDLVSAFTGTVYAIDVEGTPGDPRTSIAPLPIIVSPPELEPSEKQDPEQQP
ncbi:MAG: hypothetical protein MK085_05570, partial [Phycisphaerales bacterium]|nr:hypothetical protein [Phycisphaerales bacterium]